MPLTGANPIETVTLAELEGYETRFQALPMERVIRTLRLTIPLLELLAESGYKGSRSAQKLLTDMGHQGTWDE
jgi:hypothetical protein